MADNVTPRNAAMAYGYGVEAHPTAPGDIHGIREPVQVELPGPPPGATPDNFQGAMADAQIGAQRTGLARPITEMPKTADALLRTIHSGLLGMPGQERARFLDAIPRYYQTINDALKAAGNFTPMSGGVAGPQENPAAGPQDADAIARQMGLDPNEVRRALVQQQANPTQPQIGPPPDNAQYRPGAQGQGGGSSLESAARAQGY